MPARAAGSTRTKTIQHTIALTPAESGVLEQLRRGLDYREIARSSGRSVHTVRTISRNARQKFGARSVDELLAGLEAGTYVIAPSREMPPRAFDLTSALEMLDRAQSESGQHAMLTLRLHRDEIAALLRLGDAHQAIVSGGQRIVADLANVVGGVEKLLSRERDGRAALAEEVARTMGVHDARRRTVRGPAEIARFAAIIVRRPFRLHGADRAAVLDAFRSGYAAGMRDHDATDSLR